MTPHLLMGWDGVSGTFFLGWSATPNHCLLSSWDYKLELLAPHFSLFWTGYTLFCSSHICLYNYHYHHSLNQSDGSQKIKWLHVSFCKGQIYNECRLCHQTYGDLLLCVEVTDWEEGKLGGRALPSPKEQLRVLCLPTLASCWPRLDF
jgi:hypothetical protein